MKVGKLTSVVCVDANPSTDEVRALATKHAEFLSALNRTVKRFLDENARRWVDMQSLFSFMKIS
jgi:hypothetical protein